MELNDEWLVWPPEDIEEFLNTDSQEQIFGCSHDHGDCHE